MRFKLSCESAAEALSEFHEGSLGWPMEARLRLHLGTCEACRTLSATLKRVPELVRHALEVVPEIPPAEAQSRGREALAAVLPRLGRGARTHAPEALVPEAFRDLPESAQDAPLRLLHLVHRLFGQSPAREDQWFLPKEALALLPDPSTWRWERHGGLRVVELLHEAGATLRLVQATAGHRLPLHMHDGSESILVLAGGMVDAGGGYDPGRWVHFSEGSAHAPCMSEEGCVCLIREVGGQHFTGPLGWLRTVLA